MHHRAGLPGKDDGLRAVQPHDPSQGFATVARGSGYGDLVIAALIAHRVGGGMTSRDGDVPDSLVREAADNVSGEIARMLDASPAAGEHKASMVLAG